MLWFKMPINKNKNIAEEIYGRIIGRCAMKGPKLAQRIWRPSEMCKFATCKLSKTIFGFATCGLALLINLGFEMANEPTFLQS